jgi:peptide/nickel transport system ATP-binding protein
MTIVDKEPTVSASIDSAREPLVEIEDLVVEYPVADGSVRAVDAVSLAIYPGEIVGLAGESGCGKSTVAHSLLRILKPPGHISGGRVLFRDQDVVALPPSQLRKFRWRNVSIVFQSAMNSLNPVMRIGDQFIDMFKAHERIRKSEAFGRSSELMQLVGIDPARLRAYPHELSGGMRQRVVIAMALALNPELLIMDEPTTALDVVVQREILREIEILQRELGFAVLFITHDLSLLVEFSDRIAIMYAGKIVELGPARGLFERPLHPYTVGLMQSFPPLVGERLRLLGIPGSPPDLREPPPGCRFHPRCPRAEKKCTIDEPRLVAHGISERVACHFPGEVS